jgi:DNA-binding transcriptional ArsR family regulator
MSTERRIALTADSTELRRRLGPTAWVVFEELLLVSTGTGDGRVASVSIRTLAGRLGLAKDTVARALARLRRAGLVTASQSRTDTGAFATGSYILHIPASITLVDHGPTASTTTPRPRSRRSHQLALTLTT